jgi:hypothetical protein
MLKMWHSTQKKIRTAAPAHARILAGVATAGEHRAGRVADVSWSERACIDLLNSEVSEIAIKEAVLEVPLADYPMILTERNVLQLADEPQQPGYDEIVRKLRNFL